MRMRTRATAGALGAKGLKCMNYICGEEVKLSDIVDIGHGQGLDVCVVVLIATGEASVGFIASEWAYLKRGAIL